MDGATAPPAAADVTALTGPKRGPDADGDYVVKVKVGKGQATTVVRLVEDGSVIGRVYRSASSDRVVEFPITDAAPGEHRYTVELEKACVRSTHSPPAGRRRSCTPRRPSGSGR